jgi:two-component system sensor histidine kinase/response regulator
LQQILYNLLGNAVKFGCSGEFVDFFVDFDEGKQVVQFSVKDYGKGISPQEMKNIFEPFQQAATHEPKHGGTGLGLTITRQLVQVLGGKISVASEYGQWCEFVVQLPYTPVKVADGDMEETQGPVDAEAAMTGSESYYEDDGASSVSSASFSEISMLKETQKISHNKGAAHPQKATETPIAAQPPKATEIATIIIDNKGVAQPPKAIVISNSIIHNKGEAQPSKAVEIPTSVTMPPIPNIKVLIAEDNKINQKVLHRTLKRIGLEHVDIVENGQKAVNASASKAYDIIFMDLQMPVMDGLEATRIISARRNERNQTYPKIVFLTAHALQDYQDKAADAGGDGFISKPFKIDMIKDLIREFRLGTVNSEVSLNSIHSPSESLTCIE